MVSNCRRRRSDDGLNRSTSLVKPPPHFFTIIHSSVVPHQKLRIPRKFISEYGKNLGNHVFLQVPSGDVWKVELVKSNDVSWICTGWKEFAKYYSVGFGHFLVFRYDGNCNFHVLIFDTSASEIEYPVSGTHGEQTNINLNGKSQFPEKEDIEIDDSVKTLEDTPNTKYNTKKEGIYKRDEIEKHGIPRCRKTRQASYYEGNIEKDVSVQILDDPHVPDFPFSQTKRTNTKFSMENNHNMRAFPLDIQPRGLKRPNLMKEVKTEKENECTGGTAIGHRRHQSQVPVRMLSATAAALERAQNFKSRKPFFMVQMRQSCFSRAFGLNMPLNFVKKYLSDNQKNISLRVSDGTTWSVRCYQYTDKCTLGCGTFALDNSLKVGDVCVFELMSKGIEPELNVIIFRN